MDPDVRTTRKRGRAKNWLNSRVRWSPEERRRLIQLKNQHSHLDWNQFHDLGFFPGRTPRSLQWTCDRASGVQLPTSPSLESLDEHQRKKLRRGREEDDDYEDTSSEEEASDDSGESSCESTGDYGEPEIKHDSPTENPPDGMQPSEKPPVHVLAATGSSTDIGHPSKLADAQNRAAHQDNSSPSGKKTLETKLAERSMTPASQNLLQAAHALQQQESNLNVLEARQESQNSYLKEEIDRLRQEIAGMKRRNTQLEKAVEDLRSSSQADMEEAMLRRIHKRLNDHEELYKQRFKHLMHEVDGIKTKDMTDIRRKLESVQKRVDLHERFFKNVSAFDLLEKLQAEDANA